MRPHASPGQPGLQAVISLWWSFWSTFITPMMTSSSLSDYQLTPHQWHAAAQTSPKPVLPITTITWVLGKLPWTKEEEMTNEESSFNDELYSQSARRGKLYMCLCTCVAPTLHLGSNHRRRDHPFQPTLEIVRSQKIRSKLRRYRFDAQFCQWRVHFMARSDTKSIAFPLPCTYTCTRSIYSHCMQLVKLCVSAVLLKSWSFVNSIP